MSLRVFIKNIFKQSYNHKMLNRCVKIINNLIFKNNLLHIYNLNKSFIYWYCQNYGTRLCVISKWLIFAFIIWCFFYWFLTIMLFSRNTVLVKLRDYN